LFLEYLELINRYSPLKINLSFILIINICIDGIYMFFVSNLREKPIKNKPVELQPAGAQLYG